MMENWIEFHRLASAEQRNNILDHSAEMIRHIPVFDFSSFFIYFSLDFFWPLKILAKYLGKTEVFQCWKSREQQHGQVSSQYSHDLQSLSLPYPLLPPLSITDTCELQLYSTVSCISVTFVCNVLPTRSCHLCVLSFSTHLFDMITLVRPLFVSIHSVFCDCSLYSSFAFQFVCCEWLYISVTLRGLGNERRRVCCWLETFHSKRKRDPVRLCVSVREDELSAQQTEERRLVANTRTLFQV